MQILYPLCKLTEKLDGSHNRTCVNIVLHSHLPLSISSSSSSSLFIQTPFWWTRGPWEHLPLLPPAVSLIDGSGSSYPGLSWIITLLCFTSLYLYVCKMWCLLILMFSFLLLIFSCGLSSSRSWRWRRSFVAQATLVDASACSLTPNPSSGIYIYIYHINCIRYRVNANCKLWFCCFVLFMWHLLHVCPCWEGDPSSAALPEVSCIFSLFKVFLYLYMVFPHTKESKDRGFNVVHSTDCKAHWGNVIWILADKDKIDLVCFGFTRPFYPFKCVKLCRNEFLLTFRFVGQKVCNFMFHTI